MRFNCLLTAILLLTSTKVFAYDCQNEIGAFRSSVHSAAEREVEALGTRCLSEIEKSEIYNRYRMESSTASIVSCLGRMVQSHTLILRRQNPACAEIASSAYVATSTRSIQNHLGVLASYLADHAFETHSACPSITPDIRASNDEILGRDIRRLLVIIGDNITELRNWIDSIPVTSCRRSSNPHRGRSPIESIEKGSVEGQGSGSDW